MKKNAFTLIELLVVISIIVMIATGVVMAYKSLTGKSNQEHIVE